MTGTAGQALVDDGGPHSTKGAAVARPGRRSGPVAGLPIPAGIVGSVTGTRGRRRRPALSGDADPP
ncbi:hypothetical protein [Streptomyces sp. NPDC051657]|uniref:hypothetical protein n=1 Tax=unclassified Streptomyces TaxID=2593676 RepID=UPI00341755A2